MTRLRRLALFAVIVFLVVFALTESILVRLVAQRTIEYVHPMLIVPQQTGRYSA